MFQRDLCCFSLHSLLPDYGSVDRFHVSSACPAMQRQCWATSPPTTRPPMTILLPGFGEAASLHRHAAFLCIVFYRRIVKHFLVTILFRTSQIKCKSGQTIHDAFLKAMQMRGLTPETCVVYKRSSRFCPPFLLTQSCHHRIQPEFVGCANQLYPKGFRRCDFLKILSIRRLNRMEIGMRQIYQIGLNYCSE